MTRYYFHFRARSSLVKDEIGEIFADASSALQHASKIAQELMQGGEPAGGSIIVEEGGRDLFEVPLSDHGY
jgi:hypothetical protein